MKRFCTVYSPPLFRFVLFLAVVSPMTSWETAEPLFPLETDTELLIVGTGLLLNAGAFLLEEEATYDPGHTYDRSSVNTFDRGTMTAYSPHMDDLSVGFTLSALLSPAVLLSTSPNEWLSIGTMYAESLLLTWGFKELGKTMFPRDRPYMYFSGPPGEDVEDGDFRRSFPSGHTAMAFTGASFGSYVFNQYYPDSPWGLPVKVLSYSLAFGSGALRVASGNHYLSDVLVGAVLGTTSGFIVPWLHKRISVPAPKRSDPVSLSVTPMGFAISYRY